MRGQRRSIARTAARSAGGAITAAGGAAGSGAGGESRAKRPVGGGAVVAVCSIGAIQSAAGGAAASDRWPKIARPLTTSGPGDGRRLAAMARDGWSALFSTAFKQSKNAMALVDEQRRHVDVNHAYLRMLGHSRDEVIGRPV